MKKVRKCLFVFVTIFILSIFMGTQVAFSEDRSSESRAEEKEHYHHGVKSIAERVERIEDEMKGGLLGDWAKKITLSGAVEVEAGYEDFHFDDPAQSDEKSSDIVLATVELGIDVDIVKHVKGHVLWLYEEDDTDPVALDEGMIIIDGEDVVPLYLNAGKMYVPFGNFESHFISDPLTLELGETNESAIKVGFANEWADVGFAVFNGDINEAEEDDGIESYVINAVLTLPEGTVSGFGLTGGVSYISNIADSDGMQDVLGEEFDTEEIEDYIGGLSAFVSVSYDDRFFFEAEYVGATDKFEEEDLGLEPDEKFEPTAFNVELAYAVTGDLEVAVRYEGTDDTLNLLPEKQYGAAVTYSLFESTSLAFEYLHGEFENDDERDLFTCQLAIEF